MSWQNDVAKNESFEYHYVFIVFMVNKMESISFLKKNEIYNGDSLDLIKKIEPESISLSFWSPPYFVGKSYEKGVSYDAWQEMLKRVIHSHFNVLKKGGFCVVNIDDILAFPDVNMPKIQAPNKSKLRSPVTKEDILKVKEKFPDLNRNGLSKILGCSEQTIDRRLNGNNIRGGKYSTQTKVKLIGHNLEKYAEEAGMYLYDRRIWIKDPTWNNSQWHSNSYRAVSEFEYIYIFWKPGETIIDRSRLDPHEWSAWGSRGVWNIKSVRRNKDHEAQFPLELANRVIRLFTDENETVLDPFVGSGTTALAAATLNRNYIGFDKESKYVSLAKKRLSAIQPSLKMTSF